MSLKKLLLKREQQIKFGADIAAQETKDFLSVQEYITNRTRELKDLTAQQQKTLEIYQFCYSQYANGKFSQSQIVSMAIKYFNISTPTALKHFKDARELFGSVYQIDKQFELKIQLDLNRKMLQKAAAGNLDSYARLEKNRLDMLRELEEVEEEVEEFTGHTIIADVNPKLLGLELPTDEEIDQLLIDIEKKYGETIELSEGGEDE